jgi:hypothetical protein
MAGLIDSTAQMTGKYDDLVELRPEEDPWQGSEEASPEEQAHYDDMYADFIDLLYGPQRQNAMKMMETQQNLFQGVSQAAFTLLKGVYDEHTRKEGEVPQAALFGEGGMIATAVDELFKLANAHKLKGSEDVNQYTAAQMDMMRRVGDYLEKEQSDSSTDEAQELMLDVEEAYNPGAEAPPVGLEDQADLDAIQYQDEARAPQEAPAPAPAEAPPMPPQGGLI